MKEKGICHIRNYTNANNTSTSIVHKHWQNTFYVDSKEQMENFAQREGWTFKWMEQDNFQISYKTDAYEYWVMVSRCGLIIKSFKSVVFVL